MTVLPYAKKSLKERFAHVVTLFALLLLLFPPILFPNELAEGVLYGIEVSVFCVIPSLFPFFVLSDAVCALFTGSGNGAVGKIFSRLFRLPPSALGAFICGNICGFPLGVRAATELYESGELSKKDVEHLIGCSSIPSLGFVVGAVGASLLGSVKLGLVLYSVLLFSSILSALIFRQKERKILKKSLIARQSFNLTESIKKAGVTSLTVSSYIIFFSAVSGLIKSLFKNEVIRLALISFSELSGAVKYAAEFEFSHTDARIIIITAVLAFSGFCAHLQARSIAPREISFIKYYLMKSVQCVSATSAIAVLIFFNII